MTYEFSWLSFFIGIIILLCGGALVLWYRQIADNFGGGAGSYEKYRLYGLIACGLGFVVMLNLHTIILTAIFSMLFGNVNQ